MKTKTYNTEPKTIEFDDDNLDHVLAGPEYGQPWGCWNGWEEIGDWINEDCGFEENKMSVFV